MSLSPSREAKAGVIPVDKLQRRKEGPKGLARTELKRKQSTLRRAPISLATPEQKAKVADLPCVAASHEIPCSGVIDPMHLIDRSLAPSFGDDILIVVPCCRGHHDAYDNHELDLSPFLEPRWRDEAACAVRAAGLFGALRRITGLHWQPITTQEED